MRLCRGHSGGSGRPKERAGASPQMSQAQLSNTSRRNKLYWPVTAAQTSIVSRTIAARVETIWRQTRAAPLARRVRARRPIPAGAWPAATEETHVTEKSNSVDGGAGAGGRPGRARPGGSGQPEGGPGARRLVEGGGELARRGLERPGGRGRRGDPRFVDGPQRRDEHFRERSRGIGGPQRLELRSGEPGG